ncbi:T9SS type A sorting domain-containing protein [Taibaiella koreensis]|uniref:T9SS type A sorting domain-containing protein n=1 Tax=Taibaiella koreensis TaxID=1268548 RepID=UPI000E5A02AA|nr:T9SS type A sorting domain-containing protein [Taibaiella koreensis]
MRKTFTVMCSLCLGTMAARAQSIGPSTINATGGSTAIAGNTYEYAIGELLPATLSGPGIVITPGVLQPNKKTVGIDDKQFFAGALDIYPNPAEETIFLQPRFTTGGTLSYVLYDVLGRMMQRKDCPLSSGKEKQSISLRSLASGTYSLEVSFNQKGKLYRNAYKVQKIN